MGCYQLTYDYKTTALFVERGEKIDTLKWAVSKNTSTTFSDGAVKVLNSDVGDPIPGQKWITLYQTFKSRAENYAMMGQAFLENGLGGDMIKDWRQSHSSPEINKALDALSDVVGAIKIGMGDNVLSDLRMSQLGTEFYTTSTAYDLLNQNVIAPIILQENRSWYNENISRIDPYKFGGGGNAYSDPYAWPRK